jgi:hypothetical protein
MPAKPVALLVPLRCRDLRPGWNLGWDPARTTFHLKAGKIKLKGLFANHGA